MKIKKCIVFIICIFIIVFSIFSNIPVNADSVNITYSPFTDFVYCYDIVDSYHIEFIVYAEISDGIMVYESSPYLDEWELSAENTHVGGSYFVVGNVYLVKRNADIVDVGFSVLYDTYLGMYYDSGYWSGYNVALDATEQEIYQSGLDRGESLGYSSGKLDGYDDGYADGQALYQYGTTGYQSIYDAGKEAGIVIGRNQQIDDPVESDHAFYQMLRQIARYPVEIFTTGLNVDIFGVNVGGFLLGIGIVAIILTIFRKIRGL